MNYIAPSLESLPVESLLTAEFDVNPGAVYQRLRSTYGQVAPVDLAGVPVWLVLGYQEVLDVLRDEHTWKRDIRHWRARAEGRLPRDWAPLAAHEVRQTMFLDGAEHRAARQTFHAALSPFQDSRTPQGRELRAAVVRYADELVGALAAEAGPVGFADLNAQYTRPLMLMIVSRLFGFPEDVGEEVVVDLWHLLDAGPDAAEATGRALEAMTRVAAHCRARPGEDVTSGMLAADPSLTDEQLGREIFANALFLSDATGNMILATLLETLTSGSGGVLAAAPSTGLIGDLVNRVGLINPPTANLTFRFPAHDVRLGNFRLLAGDTVVPSLAAAHQDLMTFGGADAASRAHLAWGAGPHQCPGAAHALADTIVAVAVGRICEHFARAETTLPPNQLPWRAGPVSRGLRGLPVRYELKATGPARGGAGAPAALGGSPAADRGPKGPLAALRRMMFGSRR
ncbi:cytochrome P450 [Streptomyces sp. GC420]|uniref:cytochrome P450 n=1 Tax=Streptomyces sp. GC420 TaxID=2697568 RepID=UPI0014150E77|nr:cytochrome P450 [Streptomyces sp. GC420]NBM20543.1 cytochrome [Streptomyces sp. GC420]